jgi:amino acid transporter
MEYKIYMVCFCFGLFFAVLSALFGHIFGSFGGDTDSDVGTGGHAETGFDSSGVPGMSPFSPTVVCAFITAFGGFGAILTQIHATRSLWVSLPLAVFGAFLVALGTFFLFNSVFRRFQSSSESRVAELAGHSATVITPIPSNGVGEIAYVHGGSRYTAPAREESGAPVSNGASVRISRIVGTQFYVTLLTQK